MMGHLLAPTWCDKATEYDLGEGKETVNTHLPENSQEETHVLHDAAGIDQAAENVNQIENAPEGAFFFASSWPAGGDLRMRRPGLTLHR